ncbi:MAG: cysteine desulfurase family protein [Candidatus Cohnella colombiensis]|uniref:Cysteine desulfurase family protein n=1 Tax=Candidatus Cohnella colombiensis TaxID=3121368 RepID=A0AA95EXC6_9BACL|nr:MAG: cysteine desulfurase family protein [Cohnella sp.]
MRTYYCDHSASTPMYLKVIDTVSELMKLHYANPGSLHRAGTDAMKLMERARVSIAERFGATPSEVVFTSGGTESNNLAIQGSLLSTTRPTKHIVTTAIEHASVYETARQLQGHGIEVTFVPVDSFGKVNVDHIERAIRKDTVLISVMHVNNEVGTIQPIEQIAKAVASHPHVRFHVDGVQAIGKVPFVWKEAGVHIYTGSAHKLGGPKGVGFLLVKEGIHLSSILNGGGQESGVRSGTPNVPGIVGTSQAVRLTMESMALRREKMYELRRKLIHKIENIPELIINGYGMEATEDQVAPHIVNLSYPGMRPEVLVHTLEELGVFVSTQSACSSKSLKPSRVLLAMGKGEDCATGSIRISFGDELNEQDIEEIAVRLQMAVTKLKPLERSRR